MAYEKTVWQTGDIVTSTKLNKIENQLEACDGKILVANMNSDETGALNKTWQEIHDVMNAGGIAFVRTQESNAICLYPIHAVDQQDGSYNVLVNGLTNLATDSANGYPAVVQDGSGNNGGPK